MALIAVPQCILKHIASYEYIFDHSWANAYERAEENIILKFSGRSVYSSTRKALSQKKIKNRPFHTYGGHKNFASKNKLSSAHITFCSFDEFKNGESLGFLKRMSSQFHWKNDNYKNLRFPKRTFVT